MQRQHASTQRKLFATALVIALFAGFIWTEVWNPFAFILTVPLITIIAVVLRGMQDIWRS